MMGYFSGSMQQGSSGISPGNGDITSTTRSEKAAGFSGTKSSWGSAKNPGVCGASDELVREELEKWCVHLKSGAIRQKSPAWCLRTREWGGTMDNNSDKVVGAAARPHITPSKQRRNTISGTFSTTTRRRFSDVRAETVLFTSNSFVVRRRSKSSMTDDNKARRSDVDTGPLASDSAR